jgi:hypothetical protein
LFRLVSEAHRIRLAHLFDPVLAVHTSLVEPLPHQITAVYEAMLPRQPLRFSEIPRGEYSTRMSSRGAARCNVVEVSPASSESACSGM